MGSSVAVAVAVGRDVAVGGSGVGVVVAVGRGVTVGGTVAVAVGGVVTVGGSGEAVGVAGREVAVGGSGVGDANCSVGAGGTVATAAVPEPGSSSQAVSKQASPTAASSGPHPLVRLTTGLSSL